MLTSWCDGILVATCLERLMFSEIFIKMNQFKHAGNLQYIHQRLLCFTRMELQMTSRNASSLFVYIIVAYWNEYWRYNELYSNTSYIDSNFITNTCLIDEKLEIPNCITCHNKYTSYSINTFYDNVCDTKNILDTNVIYINNANVCTVCTQIINCDSSYDTYCCK